MDNKNFIKRTTMGVGVYFIVIAAFVVVAVFRGDFFIAISQGIVLLALILHYSINRKERQKEITSYIKDLTAHLDGATRDTMMHFPLPMLMMSLSGTVIWYNRKFLDVSGREILEEPIQSVFPSIQLLKILEQKNNISIEVTHNGKHYEVVGNVVSYSEKGDTIYSVVLYWLDRTNEKEHLKLYDDGKIVSCELMIDNLEDLIKNTPEDSRASLTVSIEQIISNWVSKADGILRMYDKDKYHIVFEKKNLQALMDSKFDILDAAHEIQVGNKLPVTLSIGIGLGDSVRESDSYAKAAIDMALGRGGDQAVIKDQEKFRFFGGRSEGFEKITKVKPRVVAHALRELIDSADTVFIMGHKNPDPDSLGAAVGLSRMVRNRNIKCHIVIGNATLNCRGILKTFKDDDSYNGVFISESEAMQIYDANSLLIIVDTHNPDIVESPKLLAAIEDRVLIDHHRRSEKFIEDTVLKYHEPYASSTCEMVTEIIQYMEESPSISALEAQAIFAGIAVDTKNFTIKTGVRTFEAASFLRRMGVDTSAVKRMFQSNLKEYVKRSKIVANAQIYRDGIAISYWDEAEEEPSILTSVASDELLNIAGINTSFVLCRGAEQIIISGRSLGDFNVQMVLEQLGGGGHMTMAGAQITATMDSAISQLKQAIDNVLDKKS